LVVANDSLSRAGLAAMLQGRRDINVTGQVPAEDLAASLAVYAPDVILWDLGLDRGDAAQRLEELRGGDGAQPTPVLALLSSASQAQGIWAAGARSLLPREVPAARLGAALPGVAAGLAVLEPAFARALFVERPASSEMPLELLTPRELEVLRLVAEGLPNKGIARHLGVSEHTVKFHINAILGKLGVESRTEAVVRATRLGLILL
jgi:DNA-binding NarL/FixJ family response regulator